MKYAKELMERDLANVNFENETLNSKLENLENVFIGSAIPRNQNGPNLKLSEDYATSTVSSTSYPLR